MKLLARVARFFIFTKIKERKAEGNSRVVSTSRQPKKQTAVRAANSVGLLSKVFSCSTAVALNLFYSATHFAIRRNQITLFQYYESLNTHKCSCASGEEQKNADLQFSAQNLVKSKKIGHHVRRCPNFRPKSSEDQKKSPRPQMSKSRPPG